MEVSLRGPSSRNPNEVSWCKKKKIIWHVDLASLIIKVHRIYSLLRDESTSVDTHILTRACYNYYLLGQVKNVILTRIDENECKTLKQACCNYVWTSLLKSIIKVEYRQRIERCSDMVGRGDKKFKIKLV